MAVIEVRDLTKRFATLTAVDHLSFTVPHGTIVGFLGPNGAGKTTTLRMMLGLVTPTEGTATFDGRAFRDLPDPLHTVGAVLEASSFHPGRTTLDHLRVQALAGRAPSSRVAEILDRVDLTVAANRRVGQLSLGMRQRLALATALLCEPEVLVLDEPSNGLDPEGIHWLRSLLRRYADDGRTVLVSSHILAEIANTVDSVVIVNHGQLVAHSTLGELTARATSTVTVRTRSADAEELVALLNQRGAVTKLIASDRLEITGATSDEVGTLAAQRSIPIFESTTEINNLEDIFLQLTTQDGTSHMVIPETQ